MRVLLIVLAFATGAAHARLTDRCEVDFSEGQVEVLMLNVETTESLRGLLEGDTTGARRDAFYRLWEPNSIEWWTEYAAMVLQFDVSQDIAQIAASIAADPVLEGLGVWDAESVPVGFCHGVPPSTLPVTLYEYFSARANRYLISTSEAENSVLAKDKDMRWQRTGQAFRTLSTDRCREAYPVYRFHHRRSNVQHFAQDGEECSALRRDPGWAYRGRPFGAAHAIDGACPEGTTPMYLMQGRRGAVQRYVWRDDLIAKLTHSGWSVVDLAMCLVPDPYDPRRHR